MIYLNHGFSQSIQNKPVAVQKMYCSKKRILLVGEGDFSFASSLATQFGIANNIVATSLDSRECLQKKYHMDAIKNIENLLHRGAQVFHEVNVCDMATKHGRQIHSFGGSFYDIINFNFPHAGFFERESNPKMIRRHIELMQFFFQNATVMLAPGGLIYVSHKCGAPYDDWNLEEQAKPNGLVFLGTVPFYSSNFPGYKHRRGSGLEAGEIFMLGKATTYIFEIRDDVWIDNIIEDPLKTGNINDILLQINTEDPLKTSNINDILLQINNLRSFKEEMIKSSRASSKNNLLQIITTEVTRLETMTSGKKKQKKKQKKEQKEKQRKLNSLKLMLKVMHLAVKVPSVVHRVTSLQATSSCKQRIQKSAAKELEEAFQEEHNTKLEKYGIGAPKEGERRTLLSEPCVEQYMFDSMKDECPYMQHCALQVEEALEIQVSDNIANEAHLESEGEEDERSFCAMVLETPLLHSTGQDVIEPENINVVLGHKIEESNHMSTIDQVDMYFQLEHQSSDEGHSDMPDLEGFSVYKTYLSDEDASLKYNYSLSERISNWISKYRCSCFGTSVSCFGTKRHRV